jgi:small subunit ribosomal protein S7
MSRRRTPTKRPIRPDPRYGSVAVAKLVNRMMSRGKRSLGYHIMYDAMDIMKEKIGKDPVEIYEKALENVKPVVEVKSRRVGGATYQVPVEVRESRREALAMRWIIQYARERRGTSMSQKLSAELMDAYNSTGSAFKKKEDTHRMAEANKAFAHYRW